MRDESGRPLPEGTLGEIHIASDMLADGYLGAQDNRTFRPDGLLTGDAGFIMNDELYVVGRIGDSIKHRGTAVFAEELEGLLRDAVPVGPTAPVVLLGTRNGTNCAAVLVDATQRHYREDLHALLAKRVPGIQIDILVLRRAEVLRTSSGKPRRRAMWLAFTAGNLGRPAPTEEWERAADQKA